MSRLPEERLADNLVETLDLRPPVNVRALLEEHASVVDTFELDECDAVVEGLPTAGKPRVLINANKPPNRQRFTMAHELAHIVIPWHTGTIVCDPDESSPELEEDLPTVTFLEAEADRFAAAVLLPVRFIDSLDEGLNSAIESMETTRASRHAAMRSLLARRAPGYVAIVLNDDGTTRATYRSPHTPAVNALDREHEVPFLSTIADVQGRAVYGKTRVHWFQLIAPELESPSRPWQDLLHDIVSDHDGQSLLPSINATTGHAHGSGEYATPSELAHHIRLFLAPSPRLAIATNDSCTARRAASRSCGSRRAGA